MLLLIFFLRTFKGSGPIIYLREWSQRKPEGILMTAPAGNREQPQNVQNEHCPEEIREVVLPHDVCSEPNPEWREPEERYRRLSIQWDAVQWGHRLLPDPDFSAFYRMGFGAIFRPFDHTPVGVFGFGAQFDLKLSHEGPASDEFLALGRVQTSLNLHPARQERLTIAALAGVRHLYGQDRSLPDLPGSQPVSGTLPVVGGELAFESSLFRWLTLSPYLGVHYTFGGEVEGDRDGPNLRIDPSVDLIAGARFTFDFLPVGE